MAIKALMVDVDGVLVDGRAEDGNHWHTSMEQDLGLAYDTLHTHFFAPHWESILLGRADVSVDLTAALEQIAPHLTLDNLLAYWFEKDSRLDVPLLEQLSLIRSSGIRVYLATN